MHNIAFCFQIEVSVGWKPDIYIYFRWGKGIGHLFRTPCISKTTSNVEKSSLNLEICWKGTITAAAWDFPQRETGFYRNSRVPSLPSRLVKKLGGKKEVLSANFMESSIIAFLFQNNLQTCSLEAAGGKRPLPSWPLVWPYLFEFTKLPMTLTRKALYQKLFTLWNFQHGFGRTHWQFSKRVPSQIFALFHHTQWGRI